MVRWKRKICEERGRRMCVGIEWRDGSQYVGDGREYAINGNEGNIYWGYVHSRFTIEFRKMCDAVMHISLLHLHSSFIWKIFIFFILRRFFFSFKSHYGFFRRYHSDLINFYLLCHVPRNFTQPFLPTSSSIKIAAQCIRTTKKIIFYNEIDGVQCSNRAILFLWRLLTSYVMIWTIWCMRAFQLNRRGCNAIDYCRLSTTDRTAHKSYQVYRPKKSTTNCLPLLS